MNNRRALSATFTAAAVLTVLFATPALYASVSEGDRHWAKRAEGLRGTVASAEPVDAAIAEYRKALEADPSNLEARWKLMRALRFKGAYVAGSLGAKKDVFDEGRQIGAKGIALVEAQLRKRGVNYPNEVSPEEIAESRRRFPVRVSSTCGMRSTGVNGLRFTENSQRFGKVRQIESCERRRSRTRLILPCRVPEPVAFWEGFTIRHHASRF